MKLGLSRVSRKLRKLYGIKGNDEVIIRDEDGKLVSKIYPMLYTEVFVMTSKGIKVLVLAKNFKRKSSQNLDIAEIATLSDYLVRYVRNRRFEKEYDFNENDVKVIGSAIEFEDGIRVSLSEIGVSDHLTNFFEQSGQRIYILNNRNKELKGGSKQ